VEIRRPAAARRFPPFCFWGGSVTCSFHVFCDFPLLFSLAAAAFTPTASCDFPPRDSPDVENSLSAQYLYPLN
jgi:hypothetical protein